MPSKTSFRQKIFLAAAGIFIALLVLELGLRLAGFIILSIQEHKNRLALGKKSGYRIMCLGESTTQNQYPKFLEETLNQRSPKIKFGVIDKGLCSIDTSLILMHLKTNLFAYQPDMVVVMAGVNDRALHMAYKADSATFPGNLRVYNLIRFIWLRIVPKTEVSLIPKSGKYREYADQYLEYRKRGEPEKAEQILKECIDAKPPDDLLYMAYVELGRFYRACSKLPQAEAAFKKAIELGSNTLHYEDMACVELAKFYCEQGDPARAGELFKQGEGLLNNAISKNPRDILAHLEIAKFYRDQHRFSEAETAFKKTVSLAPDSNLAYIAYVGLYRIYCTQGKAAEAAEALEKSTEAAAQSDNSYAMASALCGETGSPLLFDETTGSPEGIGWYNPKTVANYRKLKNILDSRGIRLVCVQYPMCSIEPLKGIFKDNPRGIIFVDNEKVFRDAVASSSYAEYFTDAFAGDFGHCTPKGNQLLAENIADAILKEISNK